MAAKRRWAAESRAWRRAPLGSGLGLLLLLLFTAAGLACGAAQRDTLRGRVDHVTDGDTLTVVTDAGRQRIRLHEIDAPEHGQPGSSEARRALVDKVADKHVRVAVVAVDDYGRLVGKVRLGNRDINRELVREGHAWAYRQYLKDRSLLADEAAAREAKRGLWAEEDVMPPWEWRQAARGERRARGAGENCLVKGNINGRGERIYHVPGSRDYANTRIDRARGERWFCSPEEAEQAGWRAPR